jgi:hypothetical protein
MKKIIKSKKEEEKVVYKKIVYSFHVDILTNKKIIPSSNITIGQDSYTRLYDALWNYIFDDYKRKDNYIKVLFGGHSKEKPEGYIYLTASELLTHLIFWRLHVVYSSKSKRKIYIEQEDFYDLSSFNKGLFGKIVDSTMEKFLEDANDVDELSYYTSFIIQDIVELAEGYSSISCNTISLYDIIQLMQRSKTFRNCVLTQLDENKTIKEIENQIKVGGKLVVDSILEDGKSNLVPYIISDRINHDQFTQMFYAIGPRTDIDKTILPSIIKGNYLQGYSSPSDYYIDAITGRDAQIAKYTNVRVSGYLSRKMNLLCLYTEIDYNVEDCGTKNYLSFTIDDERFLKSLDGKYQVLDNGKLRLINGKLDTFLIGETIQIRSHIHCALENDKICKTCFGKRTKRMRGTRIGGLPSIELANPLSKRIMKTKHFTTTNSIDIDNDIMSKYFNIESSKVYLKNDLNDKNLFIVINREYVEEIVEGTMDLEEEGIEATLPLENVTIRDNNEDFLIECDGLFLMLTDELLAESSKFIIDLDSDDALIPISKLDKENPVFTMVIITEEVSRYLKQTMKLIDSSHTKNYTDAGKLAHDILKILLDSEMSGTNIIHTETILHQMVRDSEKIYKKPNYLIPNIPYCILPLKGAILKKDLYTAIAFQEFKAQMIDYDSFVKNDQGMFDDLFKVNKPKYLNKLSKEFILASLLPEK